MYLRRCVMISSLFVALGFAGQSIADTVILVPNATFKAPGGRITGQIQSETATVVKIQSPTGAQEVPVEQIDSITYEGQPSSLARADALESTNDLNGAIDQYKKAATEAAGKPLIAQAAQFGQLHALAELALASPARANEAIAGLDAFLKANASTRHHGAALEALAKLYLQKGDSDKANQTIDELAAIPWAADRATVMKTRVLARKGKNEDAIQALDKIIAGAPKGSPRAIEARLAKAENLAALKRFDDAQATVKEVIKESPPEKAEIQALAYNTLGDCLRAAGQPKSALRAYLWTVTLYEKDKEQHPRALYQSAQLFRELKADDRADELMDELKQKYPQSPWASSRSAPK
jgi:tetratricopeptide (TPR) repeat protein